MATIVRKRNPRVASSTRSGDPREASGVRKSVRESYYLGIDASYSGYAVVVLNGDVATPIVSKFSGKRDWETVDHVGRLVTIEATLSSIWETLGGMDVSAVCLEGYARNVKQGREESGELGALTKLTLLQHLGRIPCLVAPLQLKKYVTGKTNAKKDDMKLHVFKRWGFETSDDNVADAYGLARIAQALCEGGDGHTGAQREVLSALGNDQSWRLSRTELQERFR